MQQQFSQNPPLSHSNSLVSTAGISVPIRERLSKHVIEDELQQDALRTIQKKFTLSDSNTMDGLRNWIIFLVWWVATGFGAFLSGDSFSRWLPDEVLRFLVVFYFIASFVVVVSLYFYLYEHLRQGAAYFRCLRQDYIDGKVFKRLRNTRSSKPIQSQLLQQGIAVPALVTNIEEKNRFYHVEFVYLDIEEEYRSSNVIVHPTEMADHLLYTGKNFTLLQSPGNSLKVLPYFLVTDFEVRPVKEAGR